MLLGKNEASHYFNYGEEPKKGFKPTLRLKALGAAIVAGLAFWGVVFWNVL